MKAGGFNLRKWQTNLPDLQPKMSGEDDNPLSPIVKVLGINTDNNDLCFDLEDTIDYWSRLLPTERSVLKLYQPRSLSPFIVKLKALFQRLCIDKCSDYPLEGVVLED